MDLSKKKCTPSEGGIPALKKNEIAEYKHHIQPEWNISPDNRLSREFSFAGYRQVMDFVNRVADLAEEENHHPVMHVFYSKVIIELWTNTIGGVSENDFILASKIEKLN